MCVYCLGAGHYLEHAMSCSDRLCALNGDEYSCDGQVLPCDCGCPGRCVDMVFDRMQREQDRIANREPHYDDPYEPTTS